ncbi:MAG: Fic family protein [Verrucomicrobiota bacterium]
MLSRLIPALQGLDSDLLEAFQQKLRVRWTHSSTALEGNTLDEGETLGVLQHGLTIAGKPLLHHNEVLGHSRALDLVYGWLLNKRSFSDAALFELHTAIQTAVEVDYFKPVGAWKREPNSTLAKLGGKTVINDTYAAPEHVAPLMQKWLQEFERMRNDPDVSPLDAYIWSHATFVRIHPFADGNGRMARLVANIPVLEKGFLPILIPVEKRLAYVEALAEWQMASGAVKLGSSLEGSVEALGMFRVLCTESFESSQALLSEATKLQQTRRSAK